MIQRRIAGFAVWCFAVLGLGAYVALALKRMHYPLELDCIEGVMMDHIARLAKGQPMYVQPSLQYIPLAYMPVFATVSSFLARMFGPAFWEPRLLSFASSMLLAALAAAVVFAETRRPTLAVGAAGLWTMSFVVTGSCMDVARPDSLMLFLSFLGLAVLRFTRGIPGALGAALLLTLAFFTKQHAVMFGIASVFYLAFHDRRRLLPFAIAMVLGCAGGYGLLTLWLGHWFEVFTWSIPHGWSQISRARIEHYIGHGLFGTLGALSLSAVLSLAAAPLPGRREPHLWYWAGFAAIATGLMATLDPYAYRHVLMPTTIAYCILGPIALHRIAHQLDAGNVRTHSRSVAVVYAVMAAQFLPMLYSLHDELPHPRAREAHAALVELLRAHSKTTGVLLPYHGWYARQADHVGSLQIIALDDIVRSRGNAILAKDPKFLSRMFAPLERGPGRPVIVTDIPLGESGALWRQIAPGYQLTDSLGWISVPLRPVTGNQFTPTYIYTPVEPPAGLPPSTP